jgi:hypothetical protein
VTKTPLKVDDRHGAADAVGHVRELVVWAQGHATWLEADTDFGELVRHVFAIGVADSDD